MKRFSFYNNPKLADFRMFAYRTLSRRYRIKRKNQHRSRIKFIL